MIPASSACFNITSSFIAELSDSTVKVLLFGQGKEFRAKNPTPGEGRSFLPKPFDDLKLNAAKSLRDGVDIIVEGSQVMPPNKEGFFEVYHAVFRNYIRMCFN
jgi:hypothetical protein